MADRILQAGRASIELQGDYSPQFLLHYPAKGWRNYPMPRDTRQLLNDGHAKDVIFGFFRDAVREQGCDGVIFATEMWQGRATPEGAQYINTPEWRANVDRGFVKLLELGWIERCESITITAQNADDVLLINQNFRRLASGVIEFLESDRYWTTQAGFGGRQKMFGDLRPENLG